MNTMVPEQEAPTARRPTATAAAPSWRRMVGVPATRPADDGALVYDLRAALAEPGPHLIDVEIHRG